MAHLYVKENGMYLDTKYVGGSEMCWKKMEPALPGKTCGIKKHCVKAPAPTEGFCIRTSKDDKSFSGSGEVVYDVKVNNIAEVKKSLLLKLKDTKKQKGIFGYKSGKTVIEFRVDNSWFYLIDKEKLISLIDEVVAEIGFLSKENKDEDLGAVYIYDITRAGWYYKEELDNAEFVLTRTNVDTYDDKAVAVEAHIKSGPSIMVGYINTRKSSMLAEMIDNGFYVTLKNAQRYFLDSGKDRMYFEATLSKKAPTTNQKIKYVKYDSDGFSTDEEVTTKTLSKQSNYGGVAGGIAFGLIVLAFFSFVFGLI